jgi:hypothetical protein
MGKGDISRKTAKAGFENQSPSWQRERSGQKGTRFFSASYEIGDYESGRHFGVCGQWVVKWIEVLV